MATIPMTSHPQSLPAAWAATLRAFGDAPAILGPEGDVRRSFAEIEAEAGRWAASVPEGLGRGAVAGVQIGNRPEWPALVLALARRGLVTLPLGGHLGETERAAALACAGASAWIGAEPGGGLAWHPVPGVVRAPAWPGPESGSAPDLLKLTSGTTAAPRAIRFRAGQLLADAGQIMETMGFGPGDLNYGVIPLAHSYGFSNLLLPLLAAGVPMVLSDDRMPRAILDGLARTGATVFPGMPVFFDKLAALPDPPPLPRLRLCISAGAPLTPETGGRFTERFGLRVHSFYGASECGGIAYDRGETGPYREGWVGEPMSRVRLIPREDGRITVCGPAVGEGYWPPEEEETLGSGGFVPGDLVRLEPGGGVVLTGRVSDVINVAGRKLNPGEVEAVLRRCPGVREVVVFGVPSRLRNEEAVACVAAEPGGVTAEAVLRHAQASLSLWQVPRAVWIVGAIPVSDRGKINRRALAQCYRSVKE